jgi:hypothetical protein
MILIAVLYVLHLKVKIAWMPQLRMINLTCR